MKLTACFLLFSFCISQVIGQQKISGRITDAQSNGIESATVTLLNAKDSSIVKLAITGKDGNFAISNMNDGRYFIKISAVGFKESSIDKIIIDRDHSSVDLPGLAMVRTTKTLEQVTVQSRRPFVEQKIDRMVVNVDAAVSNVGASALEVLEKSPGVSVDKDGNISLKGKQGVTILIDGKPAYVSGSDLANLLRTMNANQLDQVEIMTNPSAKYDAAGNSGIINIKTKKNKTKGLNGTINAAYGQGTYGRTNNSLNLNYRNNKINLFMNYGFSTRKGSQDLHIDRTYFAADKKTITQLFEQPTFMVSGGTNNNLKLGMDYNLDTKTTIGFVANGFINPQSFNGNSTGYIKNAGGAVDYISTSSNFSDDKWSNHGFNINFSHRFDSAGTAITADADYVSYSNMSDQSFINKQYDINRNLTNNEEIKGVLPIDINIWSGKMDFNTTLKHGLKFEAGLKSSLVNTENASNYFNLSGGAWVPDYGKTNAFEYRENINAGYVNFSREYNKWSVQAGLRYENTNYKGHQFGNVQRPDSSFSHRYNSLFPTAYLSYKADQDDRFTLSVGKRIDRPNYKDLNPFLYYINKYTYMEGNPFLLPQYTSNIELSHTHKHITTTLNYSTTKDFFTGIFKTIGDTTILSQGNLAKRQNFGVAVNTEVQLEKWWSLNVNSNLQYIKVTGYSNGDIINTAGTSYSVRANNQFKFNKGWSGELSGFYNSFNKAGQRTMKGMGQLDAGVSKQVFSNKATVRLNVRDILNTMTIDGHLKYQNVMEHFIQKREAHIVNIGFSYRFGKTVKDRKRNGSSSDEQNRVSL